MVKTEITENYYLSDLRGLLRMDDIKYDPWGTVMGALFDVCAEIYTRNPSADILATLEYSPGAGCDPREIESHWFFVYQSTDTGTLIRWARILDRYRALLALAGKDY